MSSLPAPGMPAAKRRSSATTRGDNSETGNDAKPHVHTARDPLNVLIVVPTLEVGAADFGAVGLARILNDAGHRAIVASKAGRLVADVTAAGGEFIPLDVASNNPLRMLRSALALTRIARERQCDVIHALGRSAAWSSFSRRGRAAFRFSPAGTRAIAIRTFSSISTTASWRAATAWWR